jgi:hypothetical protein
MATVLLFSWSFLQHEKPEKDNRIVKVKMGKMLFFMAGGKVEKREG